VNQRERQDFGHLLLVAALAALHEPAIKVSPKYIDSVTDKDLVDVRHARSALLRGRGDPRVAEVFPEFGHVLIQRHLVTQVSETLRSPD